MRKKHFSALKKKNVVVDDPGQKNEAEHRGAVGFLYIRKENISEGKI